MKVTDWHYNQQSDLPSCGALPSNTRWWWQGDGLECVEKKTRSSPKIESQFAGRPPPSLITVHGQLSKPNAFLKNANKSIVKTKVTRPQNHTMSLLFCHQAQQLSRYSPADASVLYKKAAVLRDTKRYIPYYVSEQSSGVDPLCLQQWRSFVQKEMDFLRWLGITYALTVRY